MSSITDFGKQADVLAQAEKKQLIADHRFDVIYPILKGEGESKRNLFKELAKQEYINPITGELIMYSDATIKRWYYTYINNTNQRSSLMVKTRQDAGKTRALTPELCEAILNLKEEHVYMSATAIHNNLVVNGQFTASLRTISQFIANQNLNHKKKHNIQRLPYEKEFANMLIAGDTNYGPYIKINGHSVRTYLIAFVDNASRLIVAARYFLADNSINIQAVLKEGVMRWGVSDFYLFDQGTPYRDKQLARIIRTMGSKVIHAKPYQPEAKAVVERAFETKDTRWLNIVHHDCFTSLEHLNEELDIYVNEYNFSIVHSALGTTPVDRWMRDKERIVYIDETNIDAYFLHTETRVVRNDLTVQINKVNYQLPEFAVKYIKKKINLFYVPDINKKSIEYMVTDGKEYFKIQKVNRIANGKRFITSKGELEDTLPVEIPELPQFKNVVKPKRKRKAKVKTVTKPILSYGGEKNELC